jgi:2-dehydro-3-deoxygluconokinase
MTPPQPLNIICAGECMVELQQKTQLEQEKSKQFETHYASSFAGDVANFAVYLKRLSTSSTVCFLSATGDDTLSDKMHAFLSSEDINLELVARSQEKTVGLYMIHTDKAGERTFMYWRSDSAAREMFELADKSRLSELVDSTDYFYFSGITLAILGASGTEQLFTLVEHCRRQGKTIVFDPNYRKSLWTSHEEALRRIDRSYQLCDILLSSAEDEKLLWGENSTEDVMDRLSRYEIDEIVLTDGPNEIVVFDNGRRFQIQSVKANRVIDTTSAGDAFNAGYIAARHAGCSCEVSVVEASSLAALVIGLPGAIIPRHKMVQL